MRSARRLLLSRRLAVAVMAVTAALLVLASFAPDPAEPSFEELRRRAPVRARLLERLEPRRLTTSPAFLVLPAYIALAVAASMWQRTSARLRSRRGPEALERFAVRRTLALPEAPGDAAGRVREALRAAGFRGSRAEGAEIHGGRGALGFAGSMVFHAGLLATLAGIGLTAAGRFTGEVVLTEGFSVALGPATVRAAVPPDGAARLRGLTIAVSDVSVEFAPQARQAVPDSRTGMTEVSAVLDARRDDAPPARLFLSVNAPASVEGHQLSIHRYGYAPEIRATDPGGQVRADAVAVLQVIPPGTEDAIPLDGGGELRLRFYPDWAPRGAEPASRSPLPVRPVLAWRWMRDGREFASGVVPRGGEAEVAGHRVAFPSLRYWLELLVSRDPGLPWFAVGALLAIAGLAVRFGWHEQAWRATLRPSGEGTRLDLVVSARYFPALLQERAERIERALGAAEERAA
jgi:cytochrome c biogenesis protein ResB